MTDYCIRGSHPAWKEADRLAALRAFDILDTEPEAVFDGIAKVAAQVCKAPIAVINFIDQQRQWFKAEIGVGFRETPLDVSICVHAILQPGLFVVPDTTKDSRFNGNPLVTGEPHLRFYAGVLLETGEGLPLGTLCVLGYVPRPDGITEEQADTLVTLARAVMSQLELKRANKRLAERERQFITLTDAMPQMVWSTGPDGKDDYHNRRWYEFTGVAPGSTDGDGWLGVYHPEDQNRAWREWQHSVETGQDYEVEYRLRHHSGEYRWVLGRATPVRNEQGRIERWFGTSTDIDDWKKAEAALARSEERYRALLVTSAVGLWIAAPDGRITQVLSWGELSGQSEEEALGQGWLDAVHPDDRNGVLSQWRESVTSGAMYQAEFQVHHAGGEYRWTSTRAVPLKDSDGSIREWVGTVSDIHERKQAEEALRISEERLRLALYAGRMIAWEHDLTTNFITRTQNAIGLLGIGSGPIAEFLDRIHPDDRHLREKVLSQADERGNNTIECRYTLPHGETLWLGMRGEKAGANRVVGVTFDITDRKAAEEEVWRVANHDALTELPNRALFQRRLEQALEEARQNGTSVSLLLIDLDHFKDVNDALGHDAGDALLKETAARLKAMVRECDTVSRFGGDEFAIIVMKPLTLEHAARWADIVLEQLRQPFVHAERTFVAGASIGVAAFPDHGTDPKDLLKDADIALYRAKAEGRNRIVTYSPALRTAVERRVSLKEELREANSKGEIVPFYQPKVCLATGRIGGFEALARWHHPTRGVLTPGYFGAVFDDPELATAIGQELIARVTSDMRQWLDLGLDIGRVAVNLSSAEFNDRGLADDILSILDQKQVPTRHFEIEVTETVLLGRGVGDIAAILKRFHEHGVQIALDDFGTGYASLTHLKQFPVNHIKIDQSFVRGLEQDAGDKAIVAAIIGLGRNLGMQITAEGVETLGQAQRLREMGCSNAQGYLYAKPMAASQVPKLLFGWAARLIGVER